MLKSINPFSNMPGLGTADGRRAWAFLAICGAGMVFTTLIIAAMFDLSDNHEYLFYLAMAAHIQVFMVIGALGWAMGRRMQSSAGKDGVSFDDRPIAGPSEEI